MGLTIETWSIAYRKRKGGLLEDGSGFRLIENGHKGWYADPFLYEHGGKTYLFAEYYSYSLHRGVIVYAVYDRMTDRFSDFKEIIREDYHLSYPLVFDCGGDIYMFPEAHKSGALYAYKATSFPDKWEKTTALIDGVQLVDTTPFVINDKLYAMGVDIQHDEKVLLLFQYAGGALLQVDRIAPCDMSLSRPGGRVLTVGDQLIAVTQDCADAYGKALNFIPITVRGEKLVFSDILQKVTSAEIDLLNAVPAEGIHTYNRSMDLEVIDLKYYRRSYYRVMRKLLSLFHR